MTPNRRSLLSILMAVGGRVGRDNISILAAGVAFYSFVAIPSALSAIVSLYGLVFNPDAIEEHIASMSGVLPGDVIQVVSDFLKALATNPHSTLGISFAVSLGIAIWSAQSSTSSMITALNVAYEEEETRNYFRFLGVSLSMTVCAIIFAVLSLALIAAVPLALALFPIESASKLIANILRWPIMVMLIAVVIGFAYRLAPDRQDRKPSWGMVGVVVATLLWLAGSALFSVYVTNFASYDKSFGSLGAVIVLLLWLYLSAFVVLLGAELNRELEHRETRKSADRPGNDEAPERVTRTA